MTGRTRRLRRRIGRRLRWLKRRLLAVASVARRRGPEDASAAAALPAVARQAEPEREAPDPRRPAASKHELVVKAVDAGLREVLRLRPRPSSVTSYRLNLLVPAITPGAAFGGASTAVDAFVAMVASSERCRIITSQPLKSPVEGYPGFRRVELTDDADHPAQLVSIAEPIRGMLPVGPRDVFVATFWPTALFVAEVRRWQAAKYGTVPPYFVYLIQDYEPAFYPRSAQSELARATYSTPQSTIAIYNTTLLRDAFRAMGFRFAREYSFEPRLSPALRSAMARPPIRRKRRIVIYGRPSKSRNAFPFLIEGLSAWQRSYPNAALWSVASIGEQHVDIDIGGGLAVEAHGKLDLTAYGALLRESAIGVSLMISPHPSYPPLEMASLGMLVLTNTYGDKDLSTWHSNVTSLQRIDVEEFSEALAELCRRFEADPGIGDKGEMLRSDFLSEEPQFTFAADVVALTRSE